MLCKVKLRDLDSHLPLFDQINVLRYIYMKKIEVTKVATVMSSGSI